MPKFSEGSLYAPNGSGGDYFVVLFQRFHDLLFSMMESCPVTTFKVRQLADFETSNEDS